MRELPLPTFPIADLESPWRLGAQVGTTIRDWAPISLWASFKFVVARALATSRGSDTLSAPTGWERG